MECVSCGTTENVSESKDPYLEEMYGDETLYWLCDACFSDRLMDV